MNAVIASGLAGRPEKLMTFNTYWESPNTNPELARMPLASIARSRRSKANRSRHRCLPGCRNRPHQHEMPEKSRGANASLLQEPCRGRHRTGKTIVAALDYKRLRDGTAIYARCTHRRNPEAEPGAFRQVLRSVTRRALCGRPPARRVAACVRVHPVSWQVDVEQLDPAAFDVVIVDEFHHMRGDDIGGCSIIFAR